MYLKPRVKLYGYHLKKDTNNKPVGILTLTRGTMLAVGQGLLSTAVGFVLLVTS